jgi:acetyltransferase
VPAIIEECVEHGVPGAIVISAGFKETGPAGAELERQIMETARGRMRIVGPNCLGVMRPPTGLNATFAAAMARPGSVGFISQSGAICTAVLDWSFRESVGFSAFVSIGSMLDVDWGDLIYYLGDDPNTQSIIIYMESIGNARSFLSAAREVALSKPIMVIKAGRTEAAAKAAASHTGALAGSVEVLDAAFRRTGVLRLNSISDIFYVSEVFAKQPRPNGPRLTVLTNAGGPGVLATDALITQGGELAELSSETMDGLNKLLPPAWSRGNPIDILGDAEPERYAKALEIAAQDPNSDGLLVILPTGHDRPDRNRRTTRSYAKIKGKPSSQAGWAGPKSPEARPFSTPSGFRPSPILTRQCACSTTCGVTVTTCAGFTRRLCSQSTPRPTCPIVPRREDHPRSWKADNFTEEESKHILAAYRIPTVPMRLARSEDEAVQYADEFGYPTVLKLHSETITHKSDVGGVQQLMDADGVRRAYRLIQTSVAEKVGPEHFLGVSVQPMVRLDGYELIVGSSLDPQFGPVLLFGTGGTLVEVFRDRALALPPLTTTLARRMIEQTMIYKALRGVRGRAAVDLVELESCWCASAS